MCFPTMCIILGHYLGCTVLIFIAYDMVIPQFASFIPVGPASQDSITVFFFFFCAHSPVVAVGRASRKDVKAHLARHGYKLGTISEGLIPGRCGWI